MIQEKSEVGFSLASYRREHMFLALSAFSLHFSWNFPVSFLRVKK